MHLRSLNLKLPNGKPKCVNNYYKSAILPIDVSKGKTVLLSIQRDGRPIIPSCSCGNTGFVRAPTSERIVCRSCFSNDVSDKVRRAINRYRMFHEGDRIAVGLSGGKDSTVLLHILSQLQKAHPHSELAVIVVDEGIHGYRDEAIKFARLAAETANTQLHLVSFKELFGYTLDFLVSRTSTHNYGQQPCSICGKFRRQALNKAARAINATKLATGHNLDDEAQTCLLNMLRGDILRFRRLSRIPVQKHVLLVPRVKPLVELTEREIQLYALVREIRHYDVECPYAPTAMRNDARNFLVVQEEKRPGTLKTIVRFHDRIMAQENQGSGSSRLELCKKCGEPASAAICSVCETLKELDL